MLRSWVRHSAACPEPSCSPAFLALATPRPAPAAPPVFAQETSDLKPDPAATWGRLPNGLRYVILPNKEPRGRASLRLVVGSGSLYETDAQRGLAHFLEHMAFNGSTHYAPGTLVEYLQRMGMGFGGDTNAYTSFDSTVYMLELPDTQTATLAEGFQVFGDYAGSLLLETKEIDKERGIILAEKRTRDSVEYRTSVAEYQFLLGDSLFPKRMPIGLTDVIESAPRPEFVDFYNAWYRPDNLAVIAVGDFDPAAVEAQIKAGLRAAPAPGAGPAAARPRPDPRRPRTARANSIPSPRRPAPPCPFRRSRPTPANPTPPPTVSNTCRATWRSRCSPAVCRSWPRRRTRRSPAATRTWTTSYDFFRNAAVELTCKPRELARRAHEWPSRNSAGRCNTASNPRN